MFSFEKKAEIKTEKKNKYNNWVFEWFEGTVVPISKKKSEALKELKSETSVPLKSKFAL